MKNVGIDTSRWKLFNNLVVGVISVWGLSTQSYTLKEYSLFDAVVIELVAPVQRSTLSMKERVAYFIDHYFSIVNTSKENEQLKSKVKELENSIFSLNEVQKENMRLKQLLQFGKEIPRQKVLAQIVSWDSSNEFKVLRINKGENDGLKLMSPVITMDGLVGYVYRLTPNYSDILTILDQNNRVDVIIADTRTHGIVEGRSGPTCSLKYVSRTETVEKGQVIITAGLGEVYPKGIRVGTISDIDKKNYGITQEIEITPSVDFHRLEEVVVLIPGEIQKEEHSAL